MTHAREPLSEIESRSTAGKNSLSNLCFVSFENHEHGSFTDSIVYLSQRAFKVAHQQFKTAEAGWSLGWLLAIDSNGRTIWIADAHRDDEKYFVVRAEEKLTALLELESAVREVCGYPHPT